MPWQPVGLLYPDAELLVTTRLRALLADGTHVDNKVPTIRPKRLVVVNRDGGSSDGLTDRPRLRIRVWDETAQKATDLARRIVALMPLLVTAPDSPVARVEHLSGPVEIPESTGAQRYLLFEIHTGGVPL